MTTVAIVCKPNREELKRLLPDLVEWLRKHGYDVVLDREGATYTDAAPAVARAELPARSPELVIVLGGDGTLLAAARIFATVGTPLLSVNLGFLGFLTEVRLADLYATLENWCSGCHSLDERAMLHAVLWRKGSEHSSFEALNEIVVSKGDIARMGEFAVELDGRSVARFRADGVIVSTPTGSTAYTLSADGPILMPSVDAMVLTAICPHLLTIRPIVFPGDTEIAVVVDVVPHETFLTVDGQETVELLLNDRILCRKSKRRVHLLRLHANGLFNVLRSKLSWGER